MAGVWVMAGVGAWEGEEDGDGRRVICSMRIICIKTCILFYTLPGRKPYILL